MSVVLSHAAPAEVILTPVAVHMWTSTIFFDTHLAAWALAHIFPEEKAPQSDDAVIVTQTLMPRFLAPEACIRATFGTN